MNNSVDIIDNKNIFLDDTAENQRPGLAIFLSGGGSNAEKLLNDKSVLEAAEVKVLVTDAPEKSRAGIIARQHGLPVVEFSIREFYRNHGLKSISLATEEGRRVRELWTDELRKRLQPYKIDFAVLAGFEPLSNITNDYPCLNVHPGDLSVVDSNGKRLYVGLHSRPVEAAILAGEKSLRASVIIAQSFSDVNADMDNGLLLGISQKMPIDFQGMTFEELQALIDCRDFDITQLEEDVLDNASYYGRIFARSGGLSESVAQALKELGLNDFTAKPLVCDGIEACRAALLKANVGKLPENFIEGMACSGGCIGGAGCLTHGPKDKTEVDKYGKEAYEKTIGDALSMLP